MTTEVSTGFQEDCFSFIEKFIKTKGLDFATFCDVWNSMNFHQIFYGRLGRDELNAFVEEVFIIIKRILVRSSHLNEKICCLYLLYSVYLKQPDAAGSKIRLTLSDWSNFEIFYNSLEGPTYRDAVIIFHQLFKIDAFHFCLYETKSFNDKDKLYKTNDVDPGLIFKPITSQLLNDLESLEANEGILNALQALEIAYNEMKDHLATGNENMDTGLPPTNLVSEVSDGINQIQEMMQRNRALRKRKMKRAKRKQEDDEETIKDKRSSIRARAVKVERRRRYTTNDTDDDPDYVPSSQKKTTPKKLDSIRDPKHFRKLTPVQQIFEHNILMNEDEPTPNDDKNLDEPSTSTIELTIKKETSKKPSKKKKKT